MCFPTSSAYYQLNKAVTNKQRSKQIETRKDPRNNSTGGEDRVSRVRTFGSIEQQWLFGK
jgi:hypothetical protein